MTNHDSWLNSEKDYDEFYDIISEVEQEMLDRKAEEIEKDIDKFMENGYN